MDATPSLTAGQPPLKRRRVDGEGADENNITPVTVLGAKTGENTASSSLKLFGGSALAPGAKGAFAAQLHETVRKQRDEAVEEVVRLTGYSRELEAENAFLTSQLKALARDTTLLLTVAERAKQLKQENAELTRSVEALKTAGVSAVNALAVIDQKASALSDSAAAQRESTIAFLSRVGGTPSSVRAPAESSAAAIVVEAASAAAVAASSEAC